MLMATVWGVACTAWYDSDVLGRSSTYGPSTMNVIPWRRLGAGKLSTYVMSSVVSWRVCLALWSKLSLYLRRVLLDFFPVF